MGRAIGARPAQIAGAFAHLGIELVDLQRILPHQPRLERQHLLFHADGRRAVGLGDAVGPGIRGDLDEGVVAARALHHHHLHVANLHALPLGSRELVEGRDERRRAPTRERHRGARERDGAEAQEEPPSGETAMLDGAHRRYLKLESDPRLTGVVRASGDRLYTSWAVNLNTEPPVAWIAAD
jgi:hypothetical protein